MKLILPFVTLLNFLDPQYNEDGEPYGPYRFKEIVRECYSIAKNCNTSYTDLLKITPRERNYLIEFIVDDARKAKEFIEENKKRIS